MPKYDQHASIFGALRRCWARHPRRRAILDAGIHPTAKGPRGGKRVICEVCNEHFAYGTMAIDHIDPVVPIGTKRKDMSYDEIVERMFDCPDSNLQRVCKDCHSKKTKAENKQRKACAKSKEDSKGHT